MTIQTTHDYGNLAGREQVWGFIGTGAQQVIGKGGGKVFYVNHAHAQADDNNDGTEPEAPLDTLQGLIDRTIALAAGTGTRQPVLEADDTVYLLSDVTESVTTGTTATMPAHVNIVGAGGSEWGPTWASDGAAQPCLTIRCESWVIQGIHFTPPTTSSAIRLEWVPASSYAAHRTVIQNCEFDGLWLGRYGIDLNGAPYDVVIRGNRFREMKQGGANAFAIYCSGAPTADPYMCVIEDNVFWENDNHIGSSNHDYGFNCSLIRRNIFHDGVGIAATLKLDLRGGSVGKNIVVGNYFGGDYSNPGGYYPNAGAPDNWIGNYAEDVAEPEVGDNGLTVAPPAA